MKKIGTPIPLLILRLVAPLQSWGYLSHWEIRDTSFEPSKSGIIGLLSCALGYPRMDPRILELSKNLEMGVRIDRSGSIRRDFQTAQGPFLMANESRSKRSDHLIFKKQYIEDGAFLVVLKGSKKILKKCMNALQNPKWPTYLGRKCCVPTCPIFESYSEKFQSIPEALKNYPLDDRTNDYLSKNDAQEKKCRILWDDPNGSIIRHDNYIASPAHLFGDRFICMDWINVKVISAIAGGDQ